MNVRVPREVLSELSAAKPDVPTAQLVMNVFNNNLEPGEKNSQQTGFA